MTIQEIVQQVQQATGINPLLRTRKAPVVRARVLFFVSAIEAGYRPTELGRATGFHHATVGYALNRAHQVLHNPKLDREMHKVLTAV